MAHGEPLSTVQYPVQLGDRGRLVLPAKLRAKLGQQARRFQGALKAGAHGGRPSEDLIADRRREAAQEDGSGARTFRGA